MILRLLPRLIVIALVVFILHRLIGTLLNWAESSAQKDMLMFGILALLILAYALLIALPFVPGIEIGLSLLALRGAEIAPMIYLATVTGLMLAFLAGYGLSYVRLSAWLRWLHLKTAADFVDHAAKVPPQDRLAVLQDSLPPAIAPWAIQGRYVMLAVLINLPGSALMGGGGGISFAAGLTRVFQPSTTLLTFAIAVAPLPLLIWGFGWDPSKYLSS